MTREERQLEAKKKKERLAKEKRLGARANANVEKKLDGVVRNQRDAREKLRAQRAKEDLQKFIKE